MGLIAGLVFVGVFTIIALPLIAGILSPSRSARQALATLDSALRMEKGKASPKDENLRKSEVISSIPWLNKKLLKFELTPYLRKLLTQAALDWSPGRLLVMIVASFALPAYVLFLYFNLTWCRWGRGWCSAPYRLALCCISAADA